MSLHDRTSLYVAVKGNHRPDHSCFPIVFDGMFASRADRVFDMWQRGGAVLIARLDNLVAAATAALMETDKLLENVQKEMHYAMVTEVVVMDSKRYHGLVCRRMDLREQRAAQVIQLQQYLKMRDDAADCPELEYDQADQDLGFPVQIALRNRVTKQ